MVFTPHFRFPPSVRHQEIPFILCPIWIIEYCLLYIVTLCPKISLFNQSNNFAIFLSTLIFFIFLLIYRTYYFNLCNHYKMMLIPRYSQDCPIPTSDIPRIFPDSPSFSLILVLGQSQDVPK